MDIASGLVFQVGHRIGRSSVMIVVASIAILSVVLVGAAWILDLLQPGSEPLISAPLRWFV